jgi:hypothetical protein
MFDRQSVLDLMHAVDAALKPLEKQFNVGFQKSKGNYSPTEIVLRISVAGTDKAGKVVNLDSENFTRFSRRYGLPADALGKTIELNGDPCTIVGLRIKARKNPIIVKTASGKNYVVPAETVLKLLNREQTVPI